MRELLTASRRADWIPAVALPLLLLLAALTVAPAAQSAPPAATVASR